MKVKKTTKAIMAAPCSTLTAPANWAKEHWLFKPMATYPIVLSQAQSGNVGMHDPCLLPCGCPAST